MRRPSMKPRGVVSDDSREPEVPQPSSRRRRKVAGIGIGTAVIGAAAVIAGVSIAGANPNDPRTGVRAPALYVGSDGGDSHSANGPDFSGTATGVNAANGNLVIHELDDPVQDAGGSTANSALFIDRWYNSRLTASRDLGRGWTTGLGYDVRLDTSSSTQVTLVAPSEHVITFPVDSTDGPFTATDDTSYTLRRIPSGWAADNSNTRRTFVFDGSGNLQHIDDSDSGQTVRFDYTSAGGQTRLSAAYGADNRAFRFSFNGNGQFIEVDNPASQHGYYGYSGNLLTRATHPNGNVSDYTYDSAQHLKTVSRSGYQLSVSYDGQDRVTSFTETVGSNGPVTATLTYRAPQPGTCDPSRDASQTDVTSTSGSSKSYCFDNNGNLDAPSSSADLPEQTIPLGNNLWSLGDIDADQATDLSLVDKTSGAVTAKLGLGDGTFDEPTSWGSFGTNVRDIAMADIDGQDTDDINGPDDSDDIVGRDASGTLGVQISNGRAVAPIVNSSGPHQTTWPINRTLGLADIDGDGSNDLWSVDPTDNTVKVALGHGDGFDAASTWATSVPTGTTVLTGDLNGDGRADLIEYTPSTGVIKAADASDTGFGTLTTRGTGPVNADVVVGNLEGQDPDDLYFRATTGVVTAQRTTLTGSISSTPVLLGTLSSDYTLSAHDMTGDGPLDVVGTKVDAANALHIRGINVAAIPGASQ